MATKGISIILLASLMLTACECNKKPDVLLFTTRVQGTIAPCGCTSDPLGGIDRLATLVKQYPGATFIDTGDLLVDPAQESACPDPDKQQLLLRTFQYLGVREVIPGSKGVAYLDLPIGVRVAVVQWPKEQLSKRELLEQPDLILWGAAPGDTPIPPFQLNPGGPWVFSAGTQGQYLAKLEFFNLKAKGAQHLNLDTRAQDRAIQREILQKRLEALKAKHLSEFVVSRIAIAQKELDNLSDVKDAPLEGPNMRFSMIPVKRDIKPDPEVESWVKAYEKKLPERLAACEGNITCPKLQAGKAVYVGDQTCQVCHAAADAFWKKAVVKLKARNERGQSIERLSGHSKAWKTLEDANKTLDRNCIGCHSVGFMKPGGYCKAQEIGVFKNVQCESCHGPGSLHVATGDKKKIQRQVSESHCRMCHHVPHIETEASFVYQEKLKVILGPGHGESLLLHLNK